MPYVEQAGQTLGGAGQTLGGVESALRAGAGPVTSEMIQIHEPFQQAVADEINRAYDRQLAEQVQLVLWEQAHLVAHEER